MLKLNRKKIVLLLLSLACCILPAPFINSLGCNASFIVRNPSLGSLYGQCEYGQVKISVNHLVTQEAYSASGIMGYWKGRYFILLTSRDVHLDEQSTDPMDVDTVTRPFYYRDFYTGDMVTGKNEEEAYIIYLYPEPTIGHISLNGKLGFITW
ncbi:hypothetical protein [Buttiauxella sp. JUb87]|uniref:hypothetical protein n=1 Tax=Buttiauxella sp. JUb87 TaxID=2485129 RepID=UPI0010606C01|nr:hypothetical protein [Buttiauxella sp. JUb87]